jgi:hypothetical protein
MRPERCYCDLDADGQCGRCRSVVNDRMRKIVTIQVDAAERINRVSRESADSCDACAVRYIDAAAAQMVREVLSKAPRTVAESQFNLLSSLLVGMGVTGLSQIVRAWDEVRRENGWDLGPGVNAE